MTGQLSLFRGKRQRGVKAPSTLEFNLHCMVADCLRRWASPGWQWFHIPSGEHRSAITGARLKRMGAQRGLPDFELLAPHGGEGRPHFLELKRKGARLTEEQAAFAVWCAANGCHYAMVDSFPDAILVLKGWGAVKATVR